VSNLPSLRAERGLSQAALAKLAGISQTLLWKLEHRTKEPKGLRTAFALAEALHCAVSDIWPEAVPTTAPQHRRARGAVSGSGGTRRVAKKPAHSRR
jgi:DNA-binding XRE family transcriptional regulator